MATAKIEYLGDLRTRCTHLASGTIIQTDAPVDNHGKGELFSPTDLCATALGACAVTLMGIYAQKHPIDVTGATAEVTKIMSSDPRRICQIDITIHMPPRSYDVETRLALEHEVNTCPVFQSLHADTIKNITFVWE